jgi:hypothetical protein
MPLRANPPPRMAGFPVLPFIFYLLKVWAVFSINLNEHLPNETLHVNCVISNNTTNAVVLHKFNNVNPPEQCLAWDLTRIWAGLVEGLRIINREHTKEQLRMIPVQAFPADLQVCIPTLNGLEE